MKRWLPAATIALAATVAANLGLWNVDWINHLEFGLHQDRVSRMPLPPSPDLKLISITQQSIDELAPEKRFLPRRLHAEMISALDAAGAKAVILDLNFAKTSNPDDDGRLRDALEKPRRMNIILVEAADTQESTEEPLGNRHRFLKPSVVTEQSLPPNVSLAQAELFQLSGKYSVIALFRKNQDGGKDVPHAALSGVMVFGGQSPLKAYWDPSRSLVTAGILAPWPVGADSEVYVRWTPPGRPFNHIDYLNARAKLASAEGRNEFRDKIVLIGSCNGDIDRHETPGGRLYGIDVIASSIDTLLDPTSRISRWRIPLELLWGFLLALLAAQSVRTLKPLPMLGGLAGALLLAWYVPIYSLSTSNLWIDTVGPFFSIGLAAALSALREGAFAASRARRLEPVHVRKARPASLTEPATVMFVDLRGSTQMAERIGPEAAQELCRSLLTRISEVVIRHGGEVERTLGDGLMAVFHDSGLHDHAARCVRAIQELPSATSSLAAGRLAPGEAGVSLTVGMESGIVSGAVVSTAEHEEWSSFGPTVNLAARLQSACSGVGRSVLLGPGAWALVRTDVPLRLIETLSLKGFKDPVPVYSIESEEREAAAV